MEKVESVVMAVLKNYTLTHHIDADHYGIGLPDRLSAEDDNTIRTGLEELETLADEIAEAIAAWNRRAAPESPWVSVEDRLPEWASSGKRIHGQDHGGNIAIGCINLRGEWLMDGEDKPCEELPEFISPLPLPQPPKEK